MLLEIFTDEYEYSERYVLLLDGLADKYESIESIERKPQQPPTPPQQEPPRTFEGVVRKQETILDTMSEPDEDPFECFDDDEDDDDEDSCQEESESKVEMKEERDPNNGFFAFHSGTERAMLRYVQDALSRNPPLADGSNRAELVVNYIDEFCRNKHWMMNLGDRKGDIVQEFLESCSKTKGNLQEPLIVVELGTYCGYSGVLLAKILKDTGQAFQLYTVEVVENHAKVARQIFELAGVSDVVHSIVLDTYRTTLEATLKEQKISQIDLLFIDHDKRLYLKDLQQLEQSGLIQKGCHVAADNVVLCGINNYCVYVKKLAQKGVVTTRLVDSWLEYYDPEKETDKSRLSEMKDGVELSVYQETPSVKLYKELQLLK